MDKNFTLKKKENYVKNDDDDCTICVKIELTANHLLDSQTVDSIEEQLFNINLSINDYTLTEDAKTLKAEQKQQLKSEKEAKQQAKQQAKKRPVIYKGKPI